MDKEQKLRMAYREFFSEDEGHLETTYIVRVSGQAVELLRSVDDPTDEDGFHESDLWAMSLDDLKKLIKYANWCIEHSESFERSHPKARETETE